MNTNRRPARIVALLGLVLLAAACTRTGLDFDSPSGPSTQSLAFTLEANPNVILATNERPSSVIKGTVRRNGQPVANLAVYFTVLLGPGEFEDYNRRIMAVTDSTGSAYATYYGPVADEIGADTTVQIKAQPETTGSDYVHKTIEVRVLKGNS